MKWELGIASCQSSDEVVFESAKSSLCSEGTMEMWRNQLEANVGLAQDTFHLCGTLIVEHVKLGMQTTVRMVFVQLGGSSDQFGCTSGLEGFSENCIAIMVKEYHDIFVAST